MVKVVLLAFVFISVSASAEKITIESKNECRFTVTQDHKSFNSGSIGDDVTLSLRVMVQGTRTWFDTNKTDQVRMLVIASCNLFRRNDWSWEHALANQHAKQDWDKANPTYEGGGCQLLKLFPDRPLETVMNPLNSPVPFAQLAAAPGSRLAFSSVAIGGAEEIPISGIGAATTSKNLTSGTDYDFDMTHARLAWSTTVTDPKHRARIDWVGTCSEAQDNSHDPKPAAPTDQPHSADPKRVGP